MDIELPGEQIEAVNQPENVLPSLTILFDPEAQMINQIKFDPEIWKTWDFIIGVLGMATEHAKMMRMVSIQSAQAQAMQQAHELQAVRGALNGNRRR